MAEMIQKIEVKVTDLDAFKEVVKALVQWAEEIKAEAYLSDAERALYNAAVKMNDSADSKG
jgi:Holliday junction resolvase